MPIGPSFNNGGLWPCLNTNKTIRRIVMWDFLQTIVAIVIGICIGAGIVLLLESNGIGTFLKSIIQ